jgi:hypothetical protein
VVIPIAVDGAVSRIPDERILVDSGIDSWVPNPLAGDHNWKKFFVDEKYTSSKKVESTWYYDSKTTIKVTTEKFQLRGETLELEGATLVWIKVIGLRPDETRHLFYGLWPEQRVSLYFGIFQNEDGTKYVEDIREMSDVKQMATGLAKEVLETLHKAIFKPWWKVW